MPPPTRDPDHDLVRACQTGAPEVSAASFARLFARHQAGVLRVCFAILRSEADALDACQETFGTVLRHLGAFQHRSLFSTWIHNVARNCSRELGRRNQREAQRCQRLADRDRTGGSAMASDTPTRWVAHRELQGIVARAVARLSPGLRAVVVLRYFEGSSYLEIAERLGLSVGTVKSRLFRAHEALQHELAAQKPSGSIPVGTVPGSDPSET